MNIEVSLPLAVFSKFTHFKANLEGHIPALFIHEFLRKERTELILIFSTNSAALQHLSRKKKEIVERLSIIYFENRANA